MNKAASVAVGKRNTPNSRKRSHHRLIEGRDSRVAEALFWSNAGNSIMRWKYGNEFSAPFDHYGWTGTFCLAAF
jgi:hypothetical protein